MVYTFASPDASDSSLRTFSTVNHPLGESALETLKRGLREGNLSLSDLWLLSDKHKNAHAALKLGPYPGQPSRRLGTLRTTHDIPDEAAAVLLTRLLALSAQGRPVHLVYNDKSARDFGTLPARCGWQGGEDHSISYRTDLSSRDDLEPDSAAVRLELGALFSGAFRAFYEPIWRESKSPSDKRTLEQTLPTLHAFAERDAGQLYALQDGNTHVGMGLVTTFASAGEQAAGVNMLGVSPDARGRGWGKRLHRHLMWAANERSPLYLGHTDASNIAMRRLFEVNGCTPSGKSWELEPA